MLVIDPATSRIAMPWAPEDSGGPKEHDILGKLIRGIHPGSREWRNRQTRWLQVPVPERAWGFNSPLAHQMTKAPGIRGPSSFHVSAEVGGSRTVEGRQQGEEDLLDVAADSGGERRTCETPR